ncbi:MAG: FAD-binding protein [Thermoplasmataceae archaeon]|jgi:succinate dehydrogenase / fumarate reductase flavoprotein subunit
MVEAYKTNECDVLIIGAGGAGMRAALAASDAGLKVIVVTKSLLGKAHTVMAEGGIAASLGNVDPDDNWTVHFADVIEEGVYISNWRMAELVAKEAPNRVFELEKFGALFDRTPDGRILQRAFGGHTYRRLCHVGDRTGLEIIRTLQDQIIHRKNVTVMDEMYITKLVLADGRVSGAIGLKMDRGEFNLFKARAVVMATGGCGRVFKVTSNSWESTGDGIGLAFNAGAVLQDMEMIQFHPTGMVYPPGVKGLLVTEGVRGEGGILYNNQKERYMERYSPKKKELDARDVVARANYAEIQAGRGTEHGGVYLDISYKGAEFVKQKLPSMYHQFMEFAGIDITKEMMEVAPTVHYQMGGIRVDPDTGATNVPGLFAAGEVACGLHGANRLGGNSLADILVFGKIVGEGATKFATSENMPGFDEQEIISEIDRVKGLVRPDGLNAYKLIDELTTTMSDNVGIVRDQEHLEIALKKILELKEKYPRVSAPGGLKYNHGLLAALELGNMLIATEAIVRSAIMRPESRGAHTRRDYPKKNPEWLKNIICSKDGDGMKFDTVPVPEIPEELKKYVKPEVY